MKINKLAACFLGAVFCCAAPAIVTANADTGSDAATAEPAVVSLQSPRLFTQLSLAMDSENGYVYAQVQNDFTLFFSTVRVVVDLYSSMTEVESISEMTLEARNSIDDLNIFESIRVQAPINGVARYWRARVRYQIDQGPWEEEMTIIRLVDANGNFVPLS